MFNQQVSAQMQILYGPPPITPTQSLLAQILSIVVSPITIGFIIILGLVILVKKIIKK